MIFVGIGLVGYSGYYVKMQCENEFIMLSAQVIDISTNPYMCSFLTKIDDGCVTTPDNTPSCKQMVSLNLTGLCDNGYYCCYYSRNCKQQTFHRAFNVNHGTCYDPIIKLNVMMTDGIIQQINHHQGLCIPVSEPNDAYGCSKQEISEFNIGQMLTVYYKDPGLIQYNPMNCPFPDGNIIGLVILVIAFFNVVIGNILCIIAHSRQHIQQNIQHNDGPNINNTNIINTDINNQNRYMSYIV
jgi:hypothetical protein